jgi:hypothetical protein
MRLIVKLMMLIAWISGIVIAKGFGSTLAAVLITPYSWYLVVEKIMLMNGWL